MTLRRLRSAWRTYGRSRVGAATAELALVLPLLTIPILNAIDVGTYIYDRMELNNAAQAAAQAVWATCAVNGDVPATPNNYCSGLTSAVTAAAQSTTLGTSVAVSSTSEAYYCLGTGTLTQDATITNNSPPACSDGNAPGDYVLVSVSYAYSPMFPAVSIASFLTTPITMTSWMRIDSN